MHQWPSVHHPLAAATQWTQHRSFNTSGVTWWHTTLILATDCVIEHERVRKYMHTSTAPTAETHWATRTLPAFDKSLGSLTVAMPEARTIPHDRPSTLRTQLLVYCLSSWMTCTFSKFYQFDLTMRGLNVEHPQSRSDHFQNASTIQKLVFYSRRNDLSLSLSIF